MTKFIDETGLSTLKGLVQRDIAAATEVASELEVRRLFRTSYALTVTITNGAYSGTTTLWTSETGIGLITSNTGYDLPSAITVSGATYAYDNTTGVITFTNPTATATVTATCEATNWTVNATITNGTWSGAASVPTGGSGVVVITPNSGHETPNSITVTGADSVYEVIDDKCYVTLTNPTANIVIIAECPVKSRYILGVSGMSQSTPALTRTDDATDITWAAGSNGAIEFTGLNTNKIWGGYIGNDEEELTWDATNKKYLHNGVEYTGDVYSKLNRFFVKPVYVEINSKQVLDGFKLCYATAAPDSTWQDWFKGKSYTKIGCYKCTGGDNITNGLQSKQGIGNSRATPNALALASTQSTSSTSTVHMQWYNQSAILQVLFYTLFATRQADDVFPQDTYRNYYDSKKTGYLDTMRNNSSIATGCGVSGGSGKKGNMFFGIEDFLGFGFDIIGGLKMTGGLVQVTDAYSTFNYSTNYSYADINLNKFSSRTHTYITSLQLSTTIPGLLLPYEGTTNSSALDTYFCDEVFLGNDSFNPVYQNAAGPGAGPGPASFYSSMTANYEYDAFTTRLCGEPL